MSSSSQQQQKAETRCASLHESNNVKYPPHYVVIMLHKRILLILTLVCASSDAFLAPVARQRRGPQSCSKAKVRNTVHLCTDEHSPDFSLGENKRSIPPLELVSLGMSGIYLSHFGSLYTQLPGLFGATGLLPINDRIDNLNDLWALHLVSSPQVGMEVFTALGILISAAQIMFRQLRHRVAGVVTFGMLWLLWHDLVITGGRFTAYQMDLLLLDAAPLSVLAASGIASGAATFGYRWLLSRLYIGAGAVKLLSCDASWRDLSAVHWHFQSQPLPNPIGAAAYTHLPESVCQAITLGVLVVEMAAPFLFLAPSTSIRQVAFLFNFTLMIGIASFGNFGPLQALLIVIGFALLDDTVPKEDSTTSLAETEEAQNSDHVISTTTKIQEEFASAIIVVSGCLAAVIWTIHNVGARCLDTWAVEPLVYGLVGVGSTIACLPILQSTSKDVITSLISLAILFGSAPTMADGLGVFLFPGENVFECLNVGASPYGLFATMTGVNGRPVAMIEASNSMEGPWHYVPLLYQVNDPLSSLPLCFPHFPRLDWTLWFIPLGEQGLWIARFFNGITTNDPAVMNLIDKHVFQESFPVEPPSIVRVVPRSYVLDSSGRDWTVSNDLRYLETPVLATFTRGDLARLQVKGGGDELPWPSTPILRPFADSGRPEYFIWSCLGSSEAIRRVIELGESNRCAVDDVEEA